MNVGNQVNSSSGRCNIESHFFFIPFLELALLKPFFRTSFSLTNLIARLIETAFLISLGAWLHTVVPTVFRPILFGVDRSVSRQAV